MSTQQPKFIKAAAAAQLDAAILEVNGDYRALINTHVFSQTTRDELWEAMTNHINGLKRAKKIIEDL